MDAGRYARGVTAAAPNPGTGAFRCGTERARPTHRVFVGAGLTFPRHAPTRGVSRKDGGMTRTWADTNARGGGYTPVPACGVRPGEWSPGPCSRLILVCPDSVDTAIVSRRLTAIQTPARVFFTPIRTDIRTEIAPTTCKSLILHAPRLIRTADLLIRSQHDTRADTCLRGVSRGDALAAVTMRALATPHSGHASGRDAR